MRFRSFALCVAIGFLGFLAGWFTSGQSRKDRGTSNLPSNGYKKLWECQFEAFEYLVTDNVQSRKSLVEGIARNAPNSGNLSNYFSGLEKRLVTFQPAEMNILNELKTDFHRDRDHLFYYYETNGGGWEEGWLIARDGKVRKKFPLAYSGR